MSALDFLARATAALSAALSEEEGAARFRPGGAALSGSLAGLTTPSQEPLAGARRLCRAEGLPVRRVLWTWGGERPRSRAPWDTEWLESRWLVPKAGPELVALVGLPPGAAGGLLASAMAGTSAGAAGLPSGGKMLSGPAFRWWLRLTRAFHGLVAREGDGASPSRSVRFLLYPRGETAGEPHPGPSVFCNPTRLHVIAVFHGSDGSVRLQASGFLAVLLGYLASQARAGEARWVVPSGAFQIVCRGPEAGTQAARLVAAAGLWWRSADLSSLYPLLSWVVAWMADACLREAASHPLCRRMSPEAVAAHVLEARLKGFWRLAHVFAETPGAEEEVAGWSREIEAEMRRRSSAGFVVAGEDRFPHADRSLRENGFIRGDRSSQADGPAGISWPAPDCGIRPADAAWPHIARGGRAPMVPQEMKGWLARHEERVDGRSMRVLDHLLTLADGDRALAEIVLRLAVECGVEWEAAARIVTRCLREGRLVPFGRRLESRTLLYFSYGSCMCRPSFRETIPHFELVGEAVLRDHRLAFTRRSAGRGGGVADLIPAPGSVVRGVLYRIPRVYLKDLDEREGVFTGHYQRTWVAVEALGVPFEDVLTYTVVNKAPREIPPSPEYAGLILDGARGLLSVPYVEELEALFESWGVDPEIPL